MNRNYRAHLHSAGYLGLALVSLLAGWAGPTGMSWWENIGAEPAPWWHLIPLAGMVGALLLKLARPTWALACGVLCVAGELSFGLNIGLLLCLTDLIYNHGIRASAAKVTVVNRTLIGIAVAVPIAVTLVDTVDSALTMLLLSTAILLVPCWWAAEVRRGYPAFVEDQVRQRLEQERHAELLAEQERRRAAAVEEERRRMARELHDVVSAQVSAVAITSGAVLNSEPDTDRDRRALQTIRTTSLTALDELRQMVHMLRNPAGEDDDAAAELLTETTWGTVIEQARQRGLEVTAEGTPPADLSAGLRAVLLRILQESLSNAHRHGPGQVQVHLQNATGQLTLTVVSPLTEAAGPGSQASQEPPAHSLTQTTDRSDRDLGSGSGLTIMQERAKSIGGRVKAGEDIHRADAAASDLTQWIVRAELPLTRAESRQGADG